MKTRLIILTLFLLVVSCENKKGVNERELRTYFEQIIKKSADSTAKLIDFKYLELDTVTLRLKMFMYSAVLQNEFDLSLEHTDLQIEKLHNYKSDYLFAKSYGLNSVGSRKYDYDRQKDKAIMFFTNDTILDEDISRLNKIASLADNTKAVNYLAKCYYSIKRPDNSVNSDTTFVYLDTLYNIISDKDFDASLIKLYPRKSKRFYDM